MKGALRVAITLTLLIGTGIAPYSAEALSPAVRNLGPVVNGVDSDFAPTVSPDGNYLFFASDRDGGQGGQDIWVSKKGIDGWERSVNLGPPVNTSLNQGPDAFFMDNGKQSLYLTFCKPWDEAFCDIFLTELLGDGSWSKPVNLGSPINTDFSDANASWDYRDRVMYFTSTRPGGIPGPGAQIPKDAASYDIWRVRLDENGWGQPEPLGEPINTPDWEGIAFFHTASRTLYFSSNGHHDGDDANIYYTKETSPGVWEQPKPVDAVNTPGNDIYFSIPAAGDLAYFSSNHHGDGFENFGLEDIYVIPIDLVLEEPVVASSPRGCRSCCECYCECEECGTDCCDRPCRSCESKPICGYDGECDSCKVETLLFSQGSSLIKWSEYPKLKEVAGYLNCNPELNIYIDGHASVEGHKCHNAELGWDRAREVKMYLKCYGVDGSRVRISTYGECKPAEQRKSKVVHPKDRRVEIYIMP